MSVQENGLAKPNRRQMLAGAAALTVPILLGARPDIANAQSGGQLQDLTAFVRIGDDGTVTIVSPTAEIGQGGATGFAQVLAEELAVRWEDVRFEFSSAAPVYANPAFGVVGTGGSTGLRARFDNIREAGAIARAKLIAAAATRWSINSENLTVSDGVVRQPDGSTLTYAELVGDAAAVEVETPALKARDQWQVIGQPLPRLDGAVKAMGTATFGIDFVLPGMLYAAIAHGPRFGVQAVEVDDSAISDRNGVSFLSMGNFVAVLAEDYWAAKSALDALSITWSDGPAIGLEQDGIDEMLRDGLQERGFVTVDEGDVESARNAEGARLIEAVYEVPYIDHMRLEPSNATAHVHDGIAEIWSSTQTVGGVTLAVALALGMPMQNVRANQLFAGGGFGRGGKMDLEIEAARLSQEVGAPVKVVWDRSEDTRHGYLRPASASHLTATVDPDANLTSWTHRTSMQAIGNWFLAEITSNGVSREALAAALPPGIRARLEAEGADPQALYGMADQAYDLPSREIAHVPVDLPIPVCPWRSVGHSNHAFDVECFMDEVANEAGVDPLAFRRKLLAHSPRHMAILDRLEEASNWGVPLPEGHGRGVAVHDCYGGLGAAVVEVEVSQRGSLTINHVTMVADLGVAVNPNLVRQQMEGGAIFGLSAALNGKATVTDGGIAETNFPDAMPLTLFDCPTFETHIIDSGKAVGGVGELSTPLMPPALCNAIAVATGHRIRKLPLIDVDLSWS